VRAALIKRFADEDVGAAAGAAERRDLLAAGLLEHENVPCVESLPKVPVCQRVIG
jgi:hypothetical protein